MSSWGFFCLIFTDGSSVENRHCQPGRIVSADVVDRCNSYPESLNLNCMKGTHPHSMYI